MAVTWLRPLHADRSRGIAVTLKIRTNYSMNPEKTINTTSPTSAANTLMNITEYSQNTNKTNGGELVKGYECDPRTVVEEFMLTKKEYERRTGRDQGNRNIIAYRIRQSFKPNEITPEKALEVGYELGLRWTKGEHA